MKNAAATLLIMMCVLGSAGADSGKNTCVNCHLFLGDARLLKPAELYDGDIHHQAGLTCADCHGGNPNDESLDAMSPAKGFRGVPKKSAVPEFCARCHSDATYMHPFNTKLRVDQLS